MTTTDHVTTEDLVATIRDAHERGWTVGQIAKTLTDWLNTQAGKTLTAADWPNSDPETRRAAANRLHELADEISDEFGIEIMTAKFASGESA